jgi:hypothetical protein
MCLVAPAQAQLMPGAFENMAHIACVDQQVAIELLVVFEENIARGEALLTRLAAEDVCDRQPFGGKPVADVYTSKTRNNGSVREGHVFEVDVTSGDVLNGRTRVYILLNIMHDNEA